MALRTEAVQICVTRVGKPRAKRRRPIAVWGTSMGADATDGGADISASVQAFIDCNPATAPYAGLALGFQGANQFNIRLPAGITSGEHTRTISRGGVTSSAVTIAIR